MTKRDELLEAAVQLLLARGEPAVTLEAVARGAGTAKGLVLYHFGTRKRLLDAVGERIVADTAAGLERLAVDYPDPRARLDALLDALFEEPPEFDRESVRHVLQFLLGAGRLARRAEAVAAFARRALDEATHRAGGARGGRVRADAVALVVEDWTGAVALWAGGTDVDFELARRAAGERVAGVLGRAR